MTQHAKAAVAAAWVAAAAGAAAGCSQDHPATKGTASAASAADGISDGATVAETAASSVECKAVTDCPPAPACAIAVCTSAGKCTATAKAEGSPCDDGNPCTTSDACLDQTCKGGNPLNCDDNNPCTADQCNAGFGCAHLPAAASTACDDGDPCTSGDSCAQGQCQSGSEICQCTANADCGKFEDGNLCNGVLYCDKSKGPPYVCALNPATVVTCPTSGDGACQKTACNPATGKCQTTFAAGNTPCDDGIACTIGDACDQGQCVGGTNTCFCKTNSDCPDDGDKCNGVPFCNKATAKCELNPATVVNCATADNTFCLQNLCNPLEGKCHLVPVNSGKPCDDGNPCTPNETCAAGQCASATDTCECKKDSDCAAKDDGNLCNGTLYCDIKSGTCVANPASVVKCDPSANTACAVNECAPKTGKCALVGLPKDGTACDDGNPCTPSSVCNAGACTPSANTCECQKDADCAAKEDNNLCNGTLFCDLKAGKCVVNPATVVACPDAFDQACISNQCDPASGKCSMKPRNQGNQCSDGSACSGGGWCDAGACVVENNNVCACQTDADCAKSEDGDLCNGTLYCDKTGSAPACKVNPASVVVCSSVGNSACAKNQCQPATGKCAVVAQIGACDDGKACTTSDTCGDGKCVGLAKACGDGNGCTSDACQEPFGCVALPANASPCDDGNACTANDACTDGKCAGKPLTCDDANPCTGDYCSADKGCVNSNNLAACDDGDPCSLFDACSQGLCISGPPTDCDDGDVCTADSCLKASGKCSHSANPAKCNDSNGCTDDTCNKDVGCVHVPNNATCTDGNPCTTGDACATGVCQPKGALTCNDSNPCSDDSCDPKVGCVFKPNAVGCDDGNACTLTEACKNLLCTPLKQLNCDDGNLCTADTCDSAKGCQYANLNAKPCDANSCTGGNLCTNGACVAGSSVKLSTSWLSKDPAYYLAGVAAFGNGDIGVVGYWHNLGVSNAATHGYGARIGTNGGALWAVDAPSLLGNSALWGAAAVANGSLVGAGNGSQADSAGVVKFAAANGTPVGTAYAGWHMDYGIANAPAGGFWLCGVSAGTFATFKRVDADFNLVGSSTSDLGTSVCYAVVGAKGNGALGVGYSQQGANSYDATVWRIDSGGGIQDVASFGTPNNDYLYAVAARPSGGFWAAGTTPIGDANHALLAALDADGKMLWQRRWDDGSNAYFKGVAGLPDDGALVVGATSAKASGTLDAWLLRTDKWGNTVWQRTMGSLGVNGLTAVALRQDVGFAAVGHTEYDGNIGTGKPLVIRADAWGNSSCASTGVCVDIGFDGCDDKDPCTADTCDAGAGCQHSKFPSGTRCSDKLLCDDDGLCALPIGMALVPAGPFWMGRLPGDSYEFKEESPLHVVTVSAYYIDKTEVTVSAYAACVKAGQCTAPSNNTVAKENNYGAAGREEHPVNSVTWQQAGQYCQWLGKRLPTEAEWEKAGRGGCLTDTPTCKNITLFVPWATDQPADCAHCNMVSGTWGCDTGYTAKVGSFPKGSTTSEVSDLIGNVSEWVSDWFDADYYGKSPAVDPAGPATGTQHIARGGNFTNSFDLLRLSSRYVPDVDKSFGIGFRCAKSVK